MAQERTGHVREMWERVVSLHAPFFLTHHFQVPARQDNLGVAKTFLSGRGIHITKDMCFPVPIRGTHITGDMSFLGRGTHITRDMCFPGRGTHITRDMCFPGRGTHITRDMCFIG